MSHMADGEKGRKGQTIKDWIVAIKELSTSDSALKSVWKKSRLKLYWTKKVQTKPNKLKSQVLLAFFIQVGG